MVESSAFQPGLSYIIHAKVFVPDILFLDFAPLMRYFIPRLLNILQETLSASTSIVFSSVGLGDFLVSSPTAVNRVCSLSCRAAWVISHTLSVPSSYPPG